jgi:hypothetical protein
MFPHLPDQRVVQGGEVVGDDQARLSGAACRPPFARQPQHLGRRGTQTGAVRVWKQPDPGRPNRPGFEHAGESPDAFQAAARTILGVRVAAVHGILAGSKLHHVGLRIEDALDRCCQRFERLLLLGVVAVAIIDAADAKNDVPRAAFGMVRGDASLYEPTSLAHLGIGHYALDGGVGYTYLNPQNGHEFSAVAGFTHNYINPYTQYQNGLDFHVDWGASQFLTKQLFIGPVGYVYNQLTGDSGSGDHVGPFKSRVVGVGPQIGYLFPVGNYQGYLNLKGYVEFDAHDRLSGHNAWLTLSISPPAPTPPASASRRTTMWNK